MPRELTHIIMGMIIPAILGYLWSRWQDSEEPQNEQNINDVIKDAYHGE